jgi:hypothetical protein
MLAELAMSSRPYDSKSSSLFFANISFPEAHEPIKGSFEATLYQKRENEKEMKRERGANAIRSQEEHMDYS